MRGKTIYPNDDYNYLLSQKKVTSISSHQLPCFNYLVSTYAGGVYTDGKPVSASATSGSLQLSGNQITKAMKVSQAYLKVYLVAADTRDDDGKNKIYELRGNAVKNFLTAPLSAVTFVELQHIISGRPLEGESALPTGDPLPSLVDAESDIASNIPQLIEQDNN